MQTTIPPDAGRSWWLHEALADDPGEPAPPLRGDTTRRRRDPRRRLHGHVDRALHLTELDPGIDVAIARAGHRGRRRQRPERRLRELVLGRGRVPRAPVRRPSRDRALRAGRGERRGDRRLLRRATGSTPGTAHDGEYVVAASDDQIGRVGGRRHRRRPARRERALPGPVSPTSCARGSPHRCSAARCSGRWAPRVHPARLARGMRRVLLERGVRFFEDTPVTRFGAGDPRARRDARAEPFGPAPPSSR